MLLFLLFKKDEAESLAAPGVGGGVGQRTAAGNKQPELKKPPKSTKFCKRSEGLEAWERILRSKLLQTSGLGA